MPTSWKKEMLADIEKYINPCPEGVQDMIARAPLMYSMYPLYNDVHVTSLNLKYIYSFEIMACEKEMVLCVKRCLKEYEDQKEIQKLNPQFLLRSYEVHRINYCVVVVNYTGMKVVARHTKYARSCRKNINACRFCDSMIPDIPTKNYKKNHEEYHKKAQEALVKILGEEIGKQLPTDCIRSISYFL